MVPIPGFRVAGALVALIAPLLAAGASEDHTSEIINQQSRYAPYWSSRIAAPEPADDPEASLALRRLIRRVQAITLDNTSPASPAAQHEPGNVKGETPLPDASRFTRNEQRTTSDDATPVRAESVRPAAPETVAPFSPKARRILEDLRQDPSRVQDPLEMAELLFLSGRPTDAVAFYEEALRRTGAGDAAAGGDRAWILFQLGNCLRETDAAKAQETYTKLIAEYPASPWTEMARAGGRLLTWYQSARPDQLMAPIRP